MGGAVKEGCRATLQCPYNIWAQTHSTVMEHNLLILLSTDKNHFKQPAGEREDI